MAVKYRVDYRNNFNDLCRVDISPIAAYTGDIILVRGVGKSACEISYSVGEDCYEPIANSMASINMIQEGQIDIRELQQASDRDFTVSFSINGVVKWIGFIIPDGIIQNFKGEPFNFNITATDGLKLLSGITYLHNNLDGGRCIINYFRQIFYHPDLLNLALPFRWVNTLVNTYYPTELDVFSGSINWADRGDGYTDIYGNRRDCMYIVEGFLKSMQCRIFQANGYWNIQRINDVVTGEYDYNETPAVLTGFTITSGSRNVNKNIFGAYDTISGDYSFIEEDAILMNVNGLKSVTTTYEQDQRDNILPNGNMDIVLPSLGKPIQWIMRFPNADFESAPSLSEARGNSVKLINNIVTGSTNIFSMEYNLPIDTDVLYTYVNFGFKFMIESGATVDSDGIIQWGTSSKFRIQLSYLAGSGIAYYLNEFGFWTTTERQIELDATKIGAVKMGDVVQVDFNSNQDIKIPLPTVSPIGQTNYPSISVNFNLQPNFVMYLDDVYLRTDTNSDVYKSQTSSNKDTANEDHTLQISSSHNGFYFSNLMTNYGMSGVEKFYSDGKSTGTLTQVNSEAILRNKYKPSLMFEGSMYGRNFEYGEIYNIKTLDTRKFLPLNVTWNTETCAIKLTALEVRDDDIAITTSHYGSNNQTLLSN